MDRETIVVEKRYSHGRSTTMFAFIRYAFAIITTIIVFGPLQLTAESTTINVDHNQTIFAAPKGDIDTSDLDCNFANKKCKWENVDKWNWVTPTSTMKLAAPLLEYDSKPVLLADFEITGDLKYTLKSGNFTLADTVACFEFDYYFMIDSNKQNILSVTIIDLNAKKQTVAWTRSGINVDRWHLGSVQFDHPSDYKILFSAMGFAGFIAIRGFRISNRECVTPICDFESNNCGYTASGSPNKYQFHINTANDVAGPIKTDHTCRSGYGHVAYLPSGDINNVARLYSPAMSELQTQCLTFWFMRIGTGIKLQLLTQSTKDHNSFHEWWRNNASHITNEWIRIQKTMRIVDPIRLVFEATKLDKSPSFIELDDIELKPYSCPPPISCPFHTNFCGWKEDTSKSKLLWALGPGRVRDPTKLKTKTTLTTMGSAVLYTDFTTLRAGAPAESMVLRSEFVDASITGGACLSLDLFVQDISLDTDSLEITRVDINTNRVSLWRFNHTDFIHTGWWSIEMYVPNPSPSIPYRIALTAISANPSTYLGIRYLTYTTDLSYCRPRSPTTTPPTTSTTTIDPKRTLNCDFEKSTFNWKIYSKSFTISMPFIIHVLKQNIFQYFPTVDHTKGTSSGHLLYVFSDKISTLKSGQLRGKNPFSVKEKICFQFYYYFYTSGPSNFTLAMSSSTEQNVGEKIIFRAYGSNINGWRHAGFTIQPNNLSPSSNKFDQFTFLAAVRQGILALDDISVNSGECAPSRSERRCEFEADTTCIFEPIANWHGVHWSVYTGAQFGLVDHTTYTRNGHFYGLDLSKIKVTGNEIRQYKILSRQLDQFHCMRFAYFLANVSPNTTLFYEIQYRTQIFDEMDEMLHRKRWQVAGNTAGIWFNRREELRNGKNINLIFGIETIGQGTGKVFVDDIVISKNECSAPHDCDFESTSNMCPLETILVTGRTIPSVQRRYLIQNNNFTRMTEIYLTDYVDQTWRMFSPQNSHLYAPVDNTRKNPYGQYLLLTGAEAFDRGIFVTERYAFSKYSNEKRQICFSLAVYKPTEGSILEIYQGESWDNTSGVKIWDLKSGQKLNWQTYEILARPFLSESIDIFFYIVGTVVDPETYIAIDDIRIDGECRSPSNIIRTTTPNGDITTQPSTISTKTPDDPSSDTHFACQNGSIIPMKLVCDWKQDCPSGEDEKYCGNCDWTNNNLCRYAIKSTLLSDLKFRFRDQVKTGPNGGVDYSNHFMIASGGTGNHAMMLSPIVRQSYADCSFKFDYNYNTTEPINNRTSAELAVYLERSDLGRRTMIWESTFENLPKGKWYEMWLTLGRIEHPFRLIFAASVSIVDPKKYHAIDDIQFKNCQPPKASEPASCVDTNQFRCTNNVCIPQSARCDFVDDCGDGSDENDDCDESLRTNFENGAGRWGENLRRGWSIKTAYHFTTLREGPTYDHTTRFDDGHFLYASLDHNLVSANAEIDGPAIGMTQAHGIVDRCFIRFNLFKNSQQSTLMILVENLYTAKRYELFSARWSNYRWSPYTIWLNGFPSGTYRILFSVTWDGPVDKFVSPYVAIDDISFQMSYACQMLPPGPITLPTGPDHSTRTTPKMPDDCPTIYCVSAKNRSKKICLREMQFCDFTLDCADGTDERDCGDCNFDNNTLCKWTTIGTLDRWIPVSPASDSPSTLPKKDANGNASGGYASIQSTNIYRNLFYVKLRSPTINGATGPSCAMHLSFQSQNGASLYFGRRIHSTSTQLYSVYYISPQWKSLHFLIGRQAIGFNIEVVAAAKTKFGFYQDVALDNFRWVNCNPNGPMPTLAPNVSVTDALTCDFETDLCGWFIGGLDGRSDWMRTDNPLEEPGKDHTGQRHPRPAKFGTWLSSQQSPKNNIGVVDRDFLITKLALKRGTKYCLTFWYYLFGIDFDSTLTLYLSSVANASRKPETDPNYNAAWSTSSPKTRNWNRRAVPIDAQSKAFYLIFVANIGSRSTIIGLDDIVLREGDCGVDDVLFCDFEINTCDWNVNTGWARNSNSDRFIDHSTGTINGHFVQATNSSTGRSPSMTKSLEQLPKFSSSSTVQGQVVCLNLYYYMETDFVTQQTMQDNRSMLTITIHNGHNGHSDHQFQVKILDAYDDDTLQTWARWQTPFTATRQMTLEIGAFLASSSTQIRVDDISIEERYCQTEGNCDFEYDTCGWWNVITRSIDGKRVAWLHIQPDSTGYFHDTSMLREDHTTESGVGKYIIFPAAMYNRAYSAFRSPPLKRTRYTEVCVSLFYFAKADKPGVIAFHLNMRDKSRNKWQHSVANCSTGELAWRSFQAEFNNLPGSFYFEIDTDYTEGTIRSDIGIDDITVMPGSCHHLPTRAPPTTPIPINEKQLDCDFENKDITIKRWTYDASMWIETRFADQRDEWAPPLDHSTQTANGRYLLFNNINNNNDHSKNTFTISSIHSLPYDKDHCLTVWYFEDGEYVFNFGIYIALSNYMISARRYTSSIDNRRRWTLLKADIPYYSSYKTSEIKIKLRYTPYVSASGAKAFSIFALDDISVRPGRCSHIHDYVYTFADNYEDLDFEPIHPIANGIGRVYTPYHVTNDGRAWLPRVDHTTNTDRGSFFLFTNELQMAPIEYIDSLSIVDLPGEQSSTCVRFAYQLTGNVTLKIFFTPKNSFEYYYRTQKPEWQAQFSKTSWTIMEINKQIAYGHKVVFYMEKPADKLSFIALDDLTILQHPCQQMIDCDFENGRTCSYTPYTDKTTSTYNFGLMTAPPQDKNWPGPQYDHSTGKYGGGYLYLTAFRSKDAYTTGIVSKIISGPRTVKPGSDYCLSAFVRLTTSDLGLKLSIVRSGSSWNGKNATITLLTLSGTQSDWSRVAATLDSTTLADTIEMQLLLEGHVTAGSGGLIAIDDIRLIDGKCPDKGFTCLNGTRLSDDKLCDFVADCASAIDEANCGTCDFDHGTTCGWTNMTKSTWRLTNSAEARLAGLPKLDADGNATGHFLLLAGQASSDDETRIEAEAALNYGTPIMYLKHAYATCEMRFDYYIRMDDRHIDRYALEIRVSEDRVSQAPIYVVQRISNTGWRSAAVHIGEMSTRFFADIRAHIVGGSRNIIVIDNVKFVNCAMPPPLPPNVTKCPRGDRQFMCRKYRFCIDIDSVCDYVNDCADGTDEAVDCGSRKRCNFEYSLETCGITVKSASSSLIHILRDDATWTISRGLNNRDPYEPKIDNTKRSIQGHYMLLAKPKIFHILPIGTTIKPAIITPIYTDDFYLPMMTSKSGGDTSCRVRFFYFINGEPLTIDRSRFDIFVRYADKLQPESWPIYGKQLNSAGDLQQRWNKAAFGWKSTKPFQFIFRGKLGTNLSRIAIDDISFDTNCVPSNVRPMTPTTTTPTTTTIHSVTGTGKTVSTSGPVTQDPNMHDKPNSNEQGGKIAAGILVPIFIVLSVIGSYYGFKKYRESQRTDEHITLSMKDIQDAQTDE